MRWKMREKEGRMHRDEILYEKGENGNEKEWKKKTKKGEKERKREKSWMKNERIEQNNGFRRLKKGKKKKGRKKEYREREKERKRREWMNESPYLDTVVVNIQGQQSLIRLFHEFFAV